MFHQRSSALTLIKNVCRSVKQRWISFLNPSCHYQTLKMASRIWLPGTRLEVQKYSHDLMESVECCHLSVLSRCLASPLLFRPNLQRHPQRYCSIVRLEFVVLFFLLLLLCVSFLPWLFVSSTCVGEGAWERSLTCSINLSVGGILTVAQHCPSFLRIHSLEPTSFVLKHIDVSIFDKFSVTFLCLCELHFLHFFHNFRFPSQFTTYHLHTKGLLGGLYRVKIC